MSSPATAYPLFMRNALLMACITMPWLNPFTASPSTAVMPLLLSWMCVACLALLVLELPLLQQTMSRAVILLMVGLACWVGSAVWRVPAVVDHALTLGLFAALVSVGLMVRVGMHVAWRGNGLMLWVARALLLAALISSVLGVLQYVGLAHELSPWVNQPVAGDAFANLRQRNQFASLTSIGLVACLALLAARAQQGPVSPRSMLGYGVVLNVLAAGVACSVSRTGAVQWLLIGGLGAVWAWRDGRHSKRHRNPLLWMALAAPVWVVVWSVWMPWLAAQLSGHNGASMILRVAGQAQDYGVCGSRRVLWSNMWQLIAQRPWQGWGWGETDYAHFITSYSGMRFCDMLDNAHNLPLHFAVEFGVPLAVALLATCAVWVWQRQPWREQDAWRSMAWGVLLVLGLHSLVEYPLWYGPFQMTFGLALGLLWCRPSKQTHPASRPFTHLDTHLGAQMPSQMSQAGGITLAGALFVACLYAAWDFNRVAQIYRAPAQRDAIYQDDPWAHAKASWLFRNQAEFAELTTQTVTVDNAQQVFSLASRVMHYSPEDRVIQRLIDSAKLLGQDEIAQTLAERLKDAQHHVQP